MSNLTSATASTVFAISRSDLKSFFMAGTEGTGEYVVIANSDFGRVGVRHLSNDRVRVRVEPKTEVGASELAAVCGDGWKQPGDGGQPQRKPQAPVRTRASRQFASRAMSMVQPLMPVGLSVFGHSRNLPCFARRRCPQAPPSGP